MELKSYKITYNNAYYNIGETVKAKPNYSGTHIMIYDDDGSFNKYIGSLPIEWAEKVDKSAEQVIIDFSKNPVYAIPVNEKTYPEIQELLLKNGWKWNTVETLPYRSDMSFIFFYTDRILKYHTPITTYHPKVTLSQLKEYLGEATMTTLDFTHTDYYALSTSSEIEFNDVQATLFGLGYEWDDTGRRPEQYRSYINHILVDKNQKMSLSSIENINYPIIQLNDLKGTKMSSTTDKPTPQYSYEQLEEIADWIEIPRPVTINQLEHFIAEGYVLRADAYTNEYVYTDSTKSWFVPRDNTPVKLSGALSTYKDDASFRLLRSATPLTDIAKPSSPKLTLDYLNSKECLIELNTYEDSLFLESLGVPTYQALRNKKTFSEEINEWGKPILLEEYTSWGGLKFYSGDYRPIITIEQIKKAFLPDDAQPSSTENVWKNPKPNKKNTQPIKEGTYYLIDGFEIPQTATCKIKGEDLSDRYPIHMLQPEQPLRIGDIICNGDEWSVIKNKDDKSKPYDSVWRVTDEKNKAIRVYELEEYSCGTLFDTVTGKTVKSIPKGAKVAKHDKVPVTFEHHEIAREFSVDIAKLEAQDEKMHAKLEIALDHPLNAARKEWAYIWGPSGSGKSTLAIDYAEKSGKKYILQQGTSQLTVDDLLGYKSITTGEYFPSLLRDAVENGKVFILDEADACNGNTLLCLNALKNKTFQFPDAEITVHPEFRLIMTANTFDDYSESYNSRNPLDKATLDRCAVINYDMKDYHLALRYGLKYIKQIDLKDKSPREIEREVINLKIQEG